MTECQQKVILIKKKGLINMLCETIYKIVSVIHYIVGYSLQKPLTTKLQA